MTFNRMGTVPLPLALHLATSTVIGLFCAFAGGLNLIDPTKIFPNGVVFLVIAGFSWGYVFGILMARKEVVALGVVAGLGYLAAGVWKLGADWLLGGRGQLDDQLGAAQGLGILQPDPPPHLGHHPLADR